ncbi:hypothetical protein ABRY23_10450 [Melioribacteraceae bacterium 4301-Me]|uniref:hypothetical protein n=1 Tax=Pyranulibacter aquaticus TaxID=3163344 RepID=UPI0035998A3F
MSKIKFVSANPSEAQFCFMSFVKPNFLFFVNEKSLRMNSKISELHAINIMDYLFSHSELLKGRLSSAGYTGSDPIILLKEEKETIG